MEKSSEQTLAETIFDFPELDLLSEILKYRFTAEEEGYSLPSTLKGFVEEFISSEKGPEILERAIKVAGRFDGLNSEIQEEIKKEFKSGESYLSQCPSHVIN